MPQSFFLVFIVANRLARCSNCRRRLSDGDLFGKPEFTDLYSGGEHGAACSEKDKEIKMSIGDKRIGLYSLSLPEGVWGSRKLNSESHFESDADLRRYEALLEMADLMVHHHSFLSYFWRWRSACAMVARRCCQLLSVRSHQQSNAPALLGRQCDKPGPDGNGNRSVTFRVGWQNQEPLVMNDLQSDTRFPVVLNVFGNNSCRSYCWLPLTTAEKRPGGVRPGQLRPTPTPDEICDFCREWRTDRCRGGERSHPGSPGARKENLHTLSGSQQHSGYDPRSAEALSRDF